MGMIANTQLKAARGPLLLDWRPEDPEFWARNGKRIASRNLWISIPALLLAFAVWMIWSTVTVRLNSAGFAFSNDQLFLLAALPSISGATLRVFYSFMVPIFGGRRWTALSTASMLIPCIWLGFAVQDPSTPYWVFALIALLCGFGGGNFASSMSNISFFYPKSQQGTALGLNAGLG
ncbi:nitrate/nitrite transporter NarK2, partial [Pseudomonas aeruginosa]